MEDLYEDRVRTRILVLKAPRGYPGRDPTLKGHGDGRWCRFHRLYLSAAAGGGSPMAEPEPIVVAGMATAHGATPGRSYAPTVYASSNAAANSAPAWW